MTDAVERMLLEIFFDSLSCAADICSGITILEKLNQISKLASAPSHSAIINIGNSKVYKNFINEFEVMARSPDASFCMISLFHGLSPRHVHTWRLCHWIIVMEQFTYRNSLSSTYCGLHCIFMNIEDTFSHLTVTYVHSVSERPLRRAIQVFCYVYVRADVTFFLTTALSGEYIVKPVAWCMDGECGIKSFFACVRGENWEEEWGGGVDCGSADVPWVE